MDLSSSTWRKSSYSSGNAGNCVEVAAGGGEVAVRDSKDRGGPAIVVSGREWRRVVARIRREEPRRH